MSEAVSVVALLIGVIVASEVALVVVNSIFEAFARIMFGQTVRMEDEDDLDIEV